MLKVVGLIGIVISTGLVGVMKADMLKRRVKLLEDFLQMTMELKGRINYFREPLPFIFAKMPQKDCSMAYNLLAEVEMELRDKTAQIPQIWPQKAEAIYKKEPLTKEDLTAVKYIGTFIGQTDYENHLVHFDYLENRLAKQIEEAEHNLLVKGTMYRKIGFFVGAVIAILFI